MNRALVQSRKLASDGHNNRPCHELADLAGTRQFQRYLDKEKILQKFLKSDDVYAGAIQKCRYEVIGTT